MVSNYWVMVNYELERKCVVVCYRELTVDRNSPRRSKENHGTPVSIVSFNVTGGGGGGEEAGTNYRGPAVRKGAQGLPMLNSSCLSRHCHYLSSVHIRTLRPSQSHFATESQSFRFNVKTVSQSGLPAGPKKCFHLGPKPLSKALGPVNLPADIPTEVSLE
jgi:hypothetical protein